MGSLGRKEDATLQTMGALNPVCAAVSPGKGLAWVCRGGSSLRLSQGTQEGQGLGQRGWLEFRKRGGEGS